MLSHTLEFSDPVEPIVHSPLAAHTIVWPSTGSKAWALKVCDVVSRLNHSAYVTPVNASPQRLPVETHHSGPMWLARPSSFGTFTLSIVLVFTGARCPTCASAARRERRPETRLRRKPCQTQSARPLRREAPSRLHALVRQPAAPKPLPPEIPPLPR